MYSCCCKVFSKMLYVQHCYRLLTKGFNWLPNVHLLWKDGIYCTQQHSECFIRYLTGTFLKFELSQHFRHLQWPSMTNSIRPPDVWYTGSVKDARSDVEPIWPEILDLISNSNFIGSRKLYTFPFKVFKKRTNNSNYQPMIKGSKKNTNICATRLIFAFLCFIAISMTNWVLYV